MQEPQELVEQNVHGAQGKKRKAASAESLGTLTDTAMCDPDHPSWIIYLVRYCENALHYKPSTLPLCLDTNTTSNYTLAAANWTKPAAPQPDRGGKVLFNILPVVVPQHKDYTQLPRP